MSTFSNPISINAALYVNGRKASLEMSHGFDYYGVTGIDAYFNYNNFVAMNREKSFVSYYSDYF